MEMIDWSPGVLRDKQVDLRKHLRHLKKEQN